MSVLYVMSELVISVIGIGDELEDLERYDDETGLI